MYRAVARANRAEPDAGRHLLGWAHAAGFDTVKATASVWCFSTPDDRAWWGGLWADRMRSSSVGDQAVEAGICTRAELDAMAEAFTEWAAHPDAWFAVLHGEIVARAPGVSRVATPPALGRGRGVGAVSRPPTARARAGCPRCR